MSHIIRGNRPNGFYVTTGANGIKIEGETRQCVHCQFIWEYKAGSGRRYGVCRSCDGLICARPECIKDQKTKLAALKLDYDCLPFEHYNYILMERAGKLSTIHGKLGIDFAISEHGGLLLPRKETKGSNLIVLP